MLCKLLLFELMLLLFACACVLLCVCPLFYLWFLELARLSSPSFRFSLCTSNVLADKVRVEGAVVAVLLVQVVQAVNKRLALISRAHTDTHRHTQTRTHRRRMNPGIVTSCQQHAHYLSSCRSDQASPPPHHTPTRTPTHPRAHAHTPPRVFCSAHLRGEVQTHLRHDGTRCNAILKRAHPQTQKQSNSSSSSSSNRVSVQNDCGQLAQAADPRL